MSTAALLLLFQVLRQSRTAIGKTTQRPLNLPIEQPVYRKPMGVKSGTSEISLSFLTTTEEADLSQIKPQPTGVPDPLFHPIVTPAPGALDHAGDDFSPRSMNDVRIMAEQSGWKDKSLWTWFSRKRVAWLSLLLCLAVWSGCAWFSLADGISTFIAFFVSTLVFFVVWLGAIALLRALQ